MAPAFKPILKGHYLEKDLIPIDLQLLEYGFTHEQLQTQEGLANYIQTCIQQKKGKVGIGGYLESRKIYNASHHFGEGDLRELHLGIDIWAEAGTPIHAPLEGVVHSFQNNNNHLDYGHTIILEHRLLDSIIYSLYGHLCKSSFKDIYKGKIITAGMAFAKIGSMEDNGGWVPHLHFQLINDMQGKQGDFPGVVLVSEKEKYANLCPNPMPWLSFA